MTKIILNLEDDEFLELGAIGFAVDCWGADPLLSSFGRLALKIKDHVQRKATPGQILYWERLVIAIREAAVQHEVSAMMVRDGVNDVAAAVDRISAEMNKADEN